MNTDGDEQTRNVLSRGGGHRSPSLLSRCMAQLTKRFDEKFANTGAR